MTEDTRAQQGTPMPDTARLEEEGNVRQRRSALGILDQAHFTRMLSIERRRAERSSRPFVLLLVDFSGRQNSALDSGLPERFIRALWSTSQETDIAGWYKERQTLGLLRPDVTILASAIHSLLSALAEVISSTLSIAEMRNIGISVLTFPEQCDYPDRHRPAELALYPDLVEELRSHRAFLFGKRVMDIAGSTFALLLFAPLFIIVPVLIKLTSPGPVLFRQPRLGQYGKIFTFLKFRSMYSTSDHSIHAGFVKQLISGVPQQGKHGTAQQLVYKLTNDPRITKFGRLLRRTSLDELPQFLNVLKGEMSLVGPRPPIPYEFASYSTWHRCRLFAVKPGITGLWQVKGRSRTSFDEMVRLDLQYAKSWSLWLDIKILVHTPRAVVSGEGAY